VLSNLSKMAPIFKSIDIIALGIFSIISSLIKQAEDIAELASTLEARADFTRLEKRADFQWRFCESSILEIFASQFAMSKQE
jgi:hypothetical protein